MSKKRELDWYTWVIAGSAIIAMSMFFYLLKPLYQPVKNGPSQQTGRSIVSAYYDENCFINILFTDGTYDRIPTDIKVVDPRILCHKTKQVSISWDKKYLVFEGSDWYAEDAVGYYPGNYLGIYFSTHKQKAIWPFGSASVSKATIDKNNFVTFEAVYEEESPIQYKKISLPFIESHFDTAVNSQTHEIKLIEGVRAR